MPLKFKHILLFVVVHLFLVLTACNGETNYQAPVVDITAVYSSPSISQSQSDRPITKKNVTVNPVEYRLPSHNLKQYTWIWPARGKVTRAFSKANQGIDIAGKAGDPVIATASGKVVYSGNGLRGYGNLVILKHENLYFSDYAHNESRIVKEGDWVKQGQVIAKMGNTDARNIMLHFEIRQGKTALDPILLLNGEDR